MNLFSHIEFFKSQKGSSTINSRSISQSRKNRRRTAVDLQKLQNTIREGVQADSIREGNSLVLLINLIIINSIIIIIYKNASLSLNLSLY